MKKRRILTKEIRVNAIIDEATKLWRFTRTWGIGPAAAAIQTYIKMLEIDDYKELLKMIDKL